MDILCVYLVTNSPKILSVAVRGAVLLDESVLLRIGRQTYAKFCASPFQNRIKNCVYNQSELDKEGCCRDSDGRVPGLEGQNCVFKEQTLRLKNDISFINVRGLGYVVRTLYKRARTHVVLKCSMI